MLPWAVIMKTKMGGTHNERNAKTILGIKPQSMPWKHVGAVTV